MSADEVLMRLGDQAHGNMGDFGKSKKVSLRYLT